MDTRTRLLDAAARVLLTTGAEQLTLAAVAKEAKVSKGGLFYHFPTKQALVGAMVQRLCEQFDAALTAAGSEPGAATRAYLENTIGAPGPTADRLATAVLAAALIDPESLVPLREMYGRWQARLERDGIDPAVATAVRLAVDGWWMASVLDMAPPQAGLHEETRAVLESLIEKG
jgi:AcrR family transcriptional regulator